MQKQIVDILKEYGLKATPQRVTILSAIERHGHANIDEIYKDAKEKHSTISLATVYKNVTSLVAIDLLKEVALNNFKSKYEINKQPHSHIVCKKCGEVEDISLTNEIEFDTAKLIEGKDFLAEDIELNIYGVCHNCQNVG